MIVVVREPIVYHYGDLTNFAAMPGMRMWLYEGDTLSVSLCPIEWVAFAPPPPGSHLYGLRRKDRTPATFIDLSRLSKGNLADIDAWATSNSLGSLAAPNIAGLEKLHGVSLTASYGELALLIAWAKCQPADGVWFSEPISAHLPDTSRGGIFQHRIPDFQETVIAAVGAPGWPVCSRPGIGWL